LCMPLFIFFGRRTTNKHVTIKACVLRATSIDTT
jgi:hypothetical protein